MARVYATADDLAAFLGDYPPVNSAQLLTRASADIDELLIGAWYDTDPNTGLPTDTGVLAALNQAVVAQVASWAQTQQPTPMEPQQDGWPRLGRAVRPVTPPVGQPVVCHEAVRILHVAGLVPVRPWVYG